MAITLDTESMTTEQVVELFDALGAADIFDHNDAVYEFRNKLISVALAKGDADFNEGTGDLVVTSLEG